VRTLPDTIPTRTSEKAKVYKKEKRARIAIWLREPVPQQYNLKSPHPTQSTAMLFEPGAIWNQF
jgi:hypothetical protein